MSAPTDPIQAALRKVLDEASHDDPGQPRRMVVIGQLVVHLPGEGGPCTARPCCGKCPR